MRKQQVVYMSSMMSEGEYKRLSSSETRKHAWLILSMNLYQAQ